MRSEALLTNPFRVAWWPEFFFSGFTANSLGLFRIYFGTCMILYNLTETIYLFELNPFGPAFHFTDPIWFFRLLGISVHVPWLTYIGIVVLFAATICVALGYRTRIAIVVMFLAIAYVQGVRDSFDGAVHHRYVVPANALIIFFFSRCGDVLSLDARRQRRLGRAIAPIQEWAGSWPLRALQVYVAFYYFFAAVAKLRLAGLSWIGDGGQVQIKLIERSMRYGLTEAGEPIRMKLAYVLAQSPNWLVVIVTAVILFELLSPLILLVRNRLARVFYVLCATGFHVFNFVLLSVNFIFYPFLLAVFFDLEKVYARLRTRFNWKPLPATAS